MNPQLPFRRFDIRLKEAVLVSGPVMRPPEEHPEKAKRFRLLLDPGPYPLARGAELSEEEVLFGLALGSFNPGTQFWDARAADTRSVVVREGRLWLEPISRELVRLLRAAEAACRESG